MVLCIPGVHPDQRLPHPPTPFLPASKLLWQQRPSFRLFVTGRHFYNWLKFYLMMGVSCWESSVNSLGAPILCTSFQDQQTEVVRCFGRVTSVFLCENIDHRHMQWILIVWGSVWWTGYQCVMVLLVVVVVLCDYNPCFTIDLLIIVLWDKYSRISYLTRCSKVIVHL